MANRLKAQVGLTYPDAASLPIVMRAGGVSKLTPEQLEKVVFRHVAAGEWCDDLPKISRANLLESGDVVSVEASEPKKTTKKKAKKGGK